MVSPSPGYSGGGLGWGQVASPERRIVSKPQLSSDPLPKPSPGVPGEGKRDPPNVSRTRSRSVQEPWEVQREARKGRGNGKIKRQDSRMPSAA